MILAFTLGLVLGSILTSLSISLFLVNKDIRDCECKTKEINEDISPRNRTTKEAKNGNKE